MVDAFSVIALVAVSAQLALLVALHGPIGQPF